MTALVDTQEVASSQSSDAACVVLEGAASDYRIETTSVSHDFRLDNLQQKAMRAGLG